MRQIKPYAWSALNLCNTRFVHQYAVRGRRHVFDAEGSITNLIFCSPLSTATRGAKMHKPLAQALVIIAAAAVASDEPSSRRLAARRGRRRPVKSSIVASDWPFFQPTFVPSAPRWRTCVEINRW